MVSDFDNKRNLGSLETERQTREFEESVQLEGTREKGFTTGAGRDERVLV
jgi:hypothetical protein